MFYILGDSSEALYIRYNYLPAEYLTIVCEIRLYGAGSAKAPYNLDWHYVMESDGIAEVMSRLVGGYDVQEGVCF